MTDNEMKGNLRIVIVGSVLVLLLFLGVAAVARGTSAPDTNDSVRAGTSVTVSLAALPASTADAYRFVADHADDIAMLPCFCGCDRSLGHHDLKDCFMNAAGGWDAHASGCVVCTDEVVLARQLLEKDTPIETVRQMIIDRYGPQPVA